MDTTIGALRVHACLRGPLRAALGLLLLASVLAPRPGNAQTVEDLYRFTERAPATGARMLGLAGAGTAGLADGSAFFHNPAGLGYFRSSAFSASFNTLFATDEANSRTPGVQGASFDEDVSAPGLANLAYVHRVPTARGSLVLGGAFNQVNTFEQRLRFEATNTGSTISTSFLPFDTEYELDDEDNLDWLDDLPYAAFQGGLIEFYPEFLPDYPFLEAVNPGTTIEQSASVIEEGRMSEVSLGGAVEAASRVMVGLSGNVTFGTYEFSSLFEEVDALDQNTAEDYTVVLDDGGTLEGFDALEYRQSLESDLLGVNLRLGLSAEVSPSLRVGMTLETPTYYTVSEDYSTGYQTFFDDGGTLSYGNDPDDVGNGEFEYEILTPWRLGAGAAFDAGTVSVSADAELVDWSQAEFESSSEDGFFDALNREIEEVYEPVINTRVGAEFILNNIALRAGLAYRPYPVDVDLQRSDGSDLDRSKTFFSAGFGYRFNPQFKFDFGWMQERFENLYSAYPEGGQEDVLLIDEDVVRNQFAVGVSFNF